MYRSNNLNMEFGRILQCHLCDFRPPLLHHSAKKRFPRLVKYTCFIVIPEGPPVGKHYKIRYCPSTAHPKTNTDTLKKQIVSKNGCLFCINELIVWE